MRITFLLAFGSLCLTIALLLAWMLGITLFFPNGALARHVVDRHDLIRAHIDYLMMAQFLLLFALLFRQYAINPPLWVVGSACYGAFFNPLGFLRRAFNHRAADASLPRPYFPVPAAVSFTMTTLGFLGAAVLIIQVALE